MRMVDIATAPLAATTYDRHDQPVTRMNFYQDCTVSAAPAEITMNKTHVFVTTTGPGASVVSAPIALVTQSGTGLQRRVHLDGAEVDVEFDSDYAVTRFVRVLGVRHDMVAAGQHDDRPTYGHQQHGGLPSLTLTVVITILFGVFGLIPAYLHTTEARDKSGVRTNRYWVAFGWSMAASIAFSIVILVGLLALVSASV